MEKQVLVYIEGEGGGGTTSKRKFNDGQFRQCWRRFLQPLADAAAHRGVSRFTCIPGRGGSATADTFSKPLKLQAGALRILIIDSEGPVTDVAQPWQAVKEDRPEWADEESCYVMVQCLETWLLADVEALAEHYNKTKKCFNEKPFKAWQQLEATPKATVQDALKTATKNCTRSWSHAESNVLIAVVRRDRLMTLPSVTRLFETLQQKIVEYAEA